MLEVLFQFESEHSDRGIMYFDIDPPFGTDPPVYRPAFIYSGVVAPLFFLHKLGVALFIRRAILLAGSLFETQPDCVALTKG